MILNNLVEGNKYQLSKTGAKMEFVKYEKPVSGRVGKFRFQLNSGGFINLTEEVIMEKLVNHE